MTMVSFSRRCGGRPPRMAGLAVILVGLAWLVPSGTSFGATVHPNHVAHHGRSTIRADDDTTCSSTQAIAFGASPIDASIVDPSQAACFTFSDPAPSDTVLMNLDPTSGTSTPSATASNGSSLVYCDNTRSSTCQLTSSGAWTLEVTGVGAENFAISVQSSANPVGCQKIAYGPTLISGQISAATESDCYLIVSPVTWMSVQVTLLSGDLDPEVALVDPDGTPGGFCNPEGENLGGGASIESPGTWLIVVESCSETATGTFDLQVQDLGVSPSGGGPHQMVSLIGQGFQEGEMVTFTYGSGVAGDPNVKLCRAKAESSIGQATCRGRVPKNPLAGPPGEHIITGVGQSSGRTVSATYDIPEAAFSCAKAKSANGAVTFTKCSPQSKPDVTATASLSSLQSGGTLTWAPSGQTTVFSGSASPLGGGCKKGFTGEHFNGTVTGGTASSTSPGDTVSVSFCENGTGTVSLVKGTTATF
jgi:hypothetical protein